MGSCISSLIPSNMFCSFVSKIAERANHFCSLEDDLDALENALAELIALKEDVVRKVNAVEEVKLWLQKVKDIESNVDELQKVRSEEIDSLCLGGFCSEKWKSSYQLEEKVAKLKQEVSNLKEEGGNFKEVAERVPAALAIKVAGGKKTIVGQQSTLEEVLRCLREEPAVGIIGLYGIGGVGKSTLLTQIKNKLCEEFYDFQVVIWVVVSNKPRFEKLQEEIGKRIGFFDESWTRRSSKDKAQDISNTLGKKKFVLLLDDMWARIDLLKAGVPLQSLKSGSKIVFTTRKIDVCDSMEADKRFEVKCLGDDEAWKLFQETVEKETLDNLSTLEQAQSIVKVCKGLPLALITIGRAVTCKKTPQEWKLAIRDLRASTSKFSGMEEVYSCLKFSYDSLSNNTIRYCLLYCSLFPKDYKICKKNLIDCWIGEGFLDDYDGGYSVIGDLLRACLLDEEDDDYVKMHNVIRDMALRIACTIEKERENILVQAGVGLIELPKVGKWKGIKRLSLMENEIESLTTVAMCPDLFTLFLNANDLGVITDDFFKSMKSLRVLDLSSNGLMGQLPSRIVKLVSLQHLDLSFTHILELPKTLSVLVNLKCLKVEHASSLRVVPKQLISEFKKLNVLRIAGCDVSNSAGQNSVLFGGCELLVEELFGLKYLNALSITLKSFHGLQKFLSSQELKSCAQSLFLAYFGELMLNISFINDMKNLDTIYIWRCYSLKFLEIDCVFHNIHTIEIVACFDLHDLTLLILASNLKKIKISSCYSMKEVISARNLIEVQKMNIGNLNPFEKLQYLHLIKMRGLQSIYPNALPFPHLKELSVEDCPNLKKLPLNSHGAKAHEIVICGEQNWWKELQWENEATQNAFFPCFKEKIKSWS